MKSLYNKATHSFQEQQIPLPDQRDYIGNDKGYAEAYHAYAHQQPTRTIACRPGDVWEEGKLYEEGKDYEAKEARTWTHDATYGYGCAECCNADRCDEDCDASYSRRNCPYCKSKGWFKEKPVFIIRITKKPETPPAQEAELWKDLMKKIFGISSFFDKPMEELFEKEIADLQTKYRLSLKSEQPEAVEFAEWLISEGHWNLGDYNDGSFTIDGLYKEYLKTK